ncbi:MAG: aspartate-semialdehyde dehydrogenase, partial [Kangiellaceae bacterium]|nr:aspartate-semialdehyde dehydrogenase [Kangiellaceae bacterium]
LETEFGNLTIEEFAVEKFVGQDYVFFATSGGHAKEFAPKAAEAGAVVIDNSSAFRLDEEVPLVVPEVNPKDAFEHKGIIANPNCSTIQMVVALNPIHQFSRIKRIVVSTYQAVSGAGQDAINELNEQLQAALNGDSVKVEQFSKQIAYNVIPHIDVFQDNGYTKEEMKMVNETWKIMGDSGIKISANCVRVPVIRAHSEAINIETESYVGENKARELFEAAPDIEVVDRRENGGYPTPLEVSETMKTFVGRIREDISCDNGIALWCVADQLWKGAALNAVQIAELLVRGE